MITIYTLAYNEELLIQFMIDHYRARFPGCQIVVNANIYTSDNTVKIAQSNGCEVRFDDNDKLSDVPITKIKNNCWRDAKTDWVLVCDMDELLDINDLQLKEEASSGATIIRTKGYDMVDMEDKLDLPGMKYGARSEALDKFYLFNKKFIKEINYLPGAHKATPQGQIVFSKRRYKLYHYCYVYYEETLKKYRGQRARIKPENLKDTPGYYSETPEEIKDLYTEARKQAIRVR